MLLTARAAPLVGILLGLSLSAAPLRAQPSSTDTPSAQQSATARKKFDQGKKLYAAGKLDQAIAAFREAHAAVPDPKTSLMIARAQRDGGELVAAHDSYRTALGEAEASARSGAQMESTLDEIKKELRDLEGVLGSVTIQLIHAPAGTTVTLDGRTLGADELARPIRVAPGQLSFVAIAPDGTEKSREITVNAGQAATVKLEFAREKAPETFFAAEGEASTAEESKPGVVKSSGGGSNTLAFVATGIGAAGLATFGVFGALSNSKFNDLEESCPDKHCPADRQEDIDQGKRFQTVANIGLAVGVVGVGTGVALFIFGGSSDKSHASRATGPRLSLGVRSVKLTGSF